MVDSFLAFVLRSDWPVDGVNEGTQKFDAPLLEAAN